MSRTAGSEPLLSLLCILLLSSCQSLPLERRSATNCHNCTEAEATDAHLEIVGRDQLVDKYGDQVRSYELVRSHCRTANANGRVSWNLTDRHVSLIGANEHYARVLIGLRASKANATVDGDAQRVQFTLDAIGDANQTTVTVVSLSLDEHVGWLSLSKFNETFAIVDVQSAYAELQSKEDAICMVRHVNKDAETDRQVELISCENEYAWDYAFCDYPPPSECYYPKNKECQWSQTDNACIWQYQFVKVNATNRLAGKVCWEQSKWPKVPCDCTKCTATQWNQWTVFTDSRNVTIGVRYRPLDQMSQWNCSILSNPCCAQFKFINVGQHVSFDTERAISMVECQHGGYKDELSSKCSCPRGTNGIFCEMNHNDCTVNHCQNGASCVDMLNGYQCACSDQYTGNHCDEKFADVVEEDKGGRSVPIQYSAASVTFALLMLLVMTHLLATQRNKPKVEEPKEDKENEKPEEASFGFKHLEQQLYQDRKLKQQGNRVRLGWKIAKPAPRNGARSDQLAKGKRRKGTATPPRGNQSRFLQQVEKVLFPAQAADDMHTASRPKAEKAKPPKDNSLVHTPKRVKPWLTLTKDAEAANEMSRVSSYFLHNDVQERPGKAKAPAQCRPKRDGDKARTKAPNAIGRDVAIKRTRDKRH